VNNRQNGDKKKLPPQVQTPGGHFVSIGDPA
jgi:hypothetical protein